MTKKYIVNCRGKTLSLSDRTYIMGILNVTPDSFSDGGRYLDPSAAIQRGIELESEGADIIDVGAESSRPGADPVPVHEELERLIPVIEGLMEKVKIPVSIDTYKAKVAEKMLNMGAHIINDISGLRFDPDMKHVISEYNAGLIIMHIKGTPKNMQLKPYYDDLMGEIITYLTESKSMAIEAGIDQENIVIDPGIGFGKRIMDNFELIRSLSKLKQLNSPILIGPSRKSFIGKVLNVEADQRLEGTSAAVAIGIQNGADIIRVHDVKKMARVTRIADLIIGKSKLSD